MNKAYVDYNSAKNTVLISLEELVCGDLTKKVNELNDIVDNISKNWQGSNAERSKQEISNIVDAIDAFKRNCLSKNVENISAQISEYQKNEEIG